MIRRPPRSTLFPYRRSSDLSLFTLFGEGWRWLVELAQYLPMNAAATDRKSTRLNSSHPSISYAVFCLKKKKDPNLRPLWISEQSDGQALGRSTCLRQRTTCV